MPDEESSGSLGDLLLREGLITDSQLTTALQVSKQTEKSLGRVLVDMGLITERVRTRLLQQKLGYDIVQVNPDQIDRTVLGYLPKSIAVRYRLVPIKLEFDTLVIAMEDPTDLTIIDLLKSTTGLRIRPVIASMDEIEAALERYPDEPAAAEVEAAPSTVVRILADILLFALLAAPLLAFVLYVPTNPELASRFARRGAYIDVFIFTLLGYGIYAVIVFEVWSLFFQPRGRKSSAPPPPPTGEF
jgi:hypothetical protein